MGPYFNSAIKIVTAEHCIRADGNTPAILIHLSAALPMCMKCKEAGCSEEGLGDSFSASHP